MKIALIRKLPLNEVKKILKESKSFVEFSRKLGYTSKSGDSLKAIKTFLIEKNLSWDHFEKKPKIKERFSKEDVLSICFQQNSKYSSSHLARYARQYKLLDDSICSRCLEEAKWFGQPLILQLDHINGVSNDNRLENLRFLCPNCHSQTPTFCGKNGDASGT